MDEQLPAAADHDAEVEKELSSTANPHIRDLMQARLSRREVLSGGVSAAAYLVLGKYTIDNPAHAVLLDPTLGFDAIPKSLADAVQVPAGYTARVLYALGDPINDTLPDFVNDGTDSNYHLRAGDHHDGMQYFGMTGGVSDPASSGNGLLCLNHENITQRYLHRTGAASVSGVRVKGQVKKEQAAHGVSVIEVQKNIGGEFEVVRTSAFNRRITPNSPISMHGPASGSPKLATLYDPAGTRTRGTINNCAHGYTPWGTYLTCEENFAFYFKRVAGDNTLRSAAENTSLARYNLNPGAAGSFGWATRPEDESRRFDISVTGASAAEDYRNEANNFGWVVEIDPFDPASRPRKRTALGRFAHEGCWPANVTPGNKVVFYMGDDQRGDYVYKFVSARPWDPADATGGLTAGNKYLNKGTLYAAKFNADGTGVWLPLVFGTGGLDASNATYPYADQGDVVINARLAADHLGATRMDRPEWCAVHPLSGEVYLTLTNNSNRGRSGNTATLDAANPRNYDATTGAIGTSPDGNVNGHIIRWAEAGGNPAATTFEWDIYAFGARAAYPAETNVSGLDDTNDFSSPDGAWFDSRGILWIQTDDGAYTDTTNCMMLAAVPGAVGDGGPVTIGTQGTFKGANPGTNLRRFLVGPKECEITGITMTPDYKTMFVNIQHPGENSGPADNSNPSAFGSHWPDVEMNPSSLARPRSATIVITRDDGGEIGVATPT